MKPTNDHRDSPTGSTRLFCSNDAEACALAKMSAMLGSNIQDIVTSFIVGAEDGARLTLQKGRDGFTVQVIGTVRRADGY